MNGIEVAQLIRERPDMALTPIVFMSGEEDIDKRFDAIRMGGDDFLAKPMKPRHLLASVTSRMSVACTQDHCRDWRCHWIRRLRTRVPAGSTAPPWCTRSNAPGAASWANCVGLIMLSVDDVPTLAKAAGLRAHR
jgi:hypothetical protein